MAANGPVQSISEGDEVLISGAIRVSAAIAERLEFSQSDGEMPARSQLIRSDDCTESRNIRARESNAG
jgi:hypothetical protein